MRDGMKSYNQVRKEGTEALARALGPVGMVRFLQQFDMGSGDYTKERHKWLDGMSVDDILEANQEILL
ncbi:MAG TPA: hypothetical protein EYP28_01230 [Methanophagales archaeon]|nr:hypothetical protein [Methanophagales archaeon]